MHDRARGLPPNPDPADRPFPRLLDSRQPGRGPEPEPTPEVAGVELADLGRIALLAWTPEQWAALPDWRKPPDARLMAGAWVAARAY